MRAWVALLRHVMLSMLLTLSNKHMLQTTQTDALVTLVLLQYALVCIALIGLRWFRHRIPPVLLKKLQSPSFTPLRIELMKASVFPGICHVALVLTAMETLKHSPLTWFLLSRKTHVLVVLLLSPSKMPSLKMISICGFAAGSLLLMITDSIFFSFDLFWMISRTCFSLGMFKFLYDFQLVARSYSDRVEFTEMIIYLNFVAFPVSLILHLVCGSFQAVFQDALLSMDSLVKIIFLIQPALLNLSISRLGRVAVKKESHVLLFLIRFPGLHSPQSRGN